MGHAVILDTFGGKIRWYKSHHNNDAAQAKNISPSIIQGPVIGTLERIPNAVRVRCRRHSSVLSKNKLQSI